MARKDTVKTVLEASKSLAASFTTTPTLIPYLDNISYQINILTSNSIGTFAVQASNDYTKNTVTNEGVSDAGNWVDLYLGSPGPNANAANDSILINLNQVPFTALRIAYTPSVAGTGTCEIIVVGRQIGG